MGISYWLVSKEDRRRREAVRATTDAGAGAMSAAAVPLAAPDRPINGVALTIVILLFVLVAVLGFVAARWRRGEETGLHSLDEWGLGGRGFGTWVTWFLLGGDLYTAYTFVAVPAAMWATGAVSGFFAVPYTIVLYPIVFLLMSRLWSVSHRHGFVTPADFVGGRYGSRALTLAVAVTGIVATMPYIALQLVGIKAVLTVLGLGSAENVLLTDLPLIIAFVVLAAYTYTSGLRAPALIAVVKDLLIYLAVHRGGHLPADQVRRLGHHLRCRRDETRRRQPGHRQTRWRRSFRARPATPPTGRWPWARPWRCSCTRTRSPASWPPRAGTRSARTRRCCRCTR